ncbi:MAG: hypothetical protein JRH16_19320 [Deltaproteobacteria bacterium]|nr:hypothetical protein [Deltaproteobacteria bacterium]MBW2362861.1 hypothetical protein [Deltaproteobacteria bacterium]
MRRAQTRHLLLLIALLHLAVDVAFAGGVVICVGPDDHRALESEHISRLGCEASSLLGEAGHAAADFSPRDCSDSPVHSEAEMVSREEDPAAFVVWRVALPIPLELDAPLAGTTLGVLARAPALAPGLLAHRTTVLLL